MLKNLQKYSMKKAIIQQKKFKQYINKYEEIPEVLQQFMEKHVINFIDRYLLYLKDSEIEKKNILQIRQLLQKYRFRNNKKTLQNQKWNIKQLYYQMVDWTDKKEKDNLSL